MNSKFGFYINLFAFSLFALTPAFYLEFEWFKTLIDRFPFMTNRSIKVANLNSILEIAIGVNLALSVIEQFANYMVSHFHSAVSVLGKDNVTFVEAMREAAEKVAKTLNIDLDQNNLLHLQEKYSTHIEEMKKEFASNSKSYMQWVKALGFVTAFVFFWILINAGLTEAVEIPKFFAHLIWVAAILPIGLYLLGLCFMYLVYRHEVRTFESAGQKQNYYKIFIQDTMQIYSSKVKELKKADDLLKKASLNMVKK